MFKSFLLAGAALVAATTILPSFGHAQRFIVAPQPPAAAPITSRRDTAIFAGGCFWGVEGVFSHVTGVVSATSGYAGGAASTARYEQVANGDTGHAEAVRVVYDPAKISYGQLLRIYFSVVADPTELNRQGPDEGTQYRSALFPTSMQQAQIARKYIRQISSAHLYKRPVVTSIEAGKQFYPAESYHQHYLALHPNASYIVINDLPKVEALKRIFPTAYRS